MHTVQDLNRSFNSFLVVSVDCKCHRHSSKVRVTLERSRKDSQLTETDARLVEYESRLVVTVIFEQFTWITDSTCFICRTRVYGSGAVKRHEPLVRQEPVLQRMQLFEVPFSSASDFVCLSSRAADRKRSGLPAVPHSLVAA